MYWLKFRQYTGTKMLKVNYNYGHKIPCPLCKIKEDTQQHLLICSKLKESLPTLKSNHADFEDAYNGDDLDRVNELSIIIERLIQRRAILLESIKDT